jgi:hypothetical protein
MKPTSKKYNEKPILEDTFTNRKVEYKKLYLDEKTKKYRETIGYNLIKKEYESEAISIVYKKLKLEGDRLTIINADSIAHKRLEAAGVMHWFEPVYKPETITLKSGIKLQESDIDEVRGILIERYAKL